MSDVKNIALADDHTMFRKGLAVLINLFPGYHVSMEAANGRELIDKLDPHHLPDIVLLDIHMPVMDGYATAAWLHKNHPAIRVLALSTMDADSTIIKDDSSGCPGIYPQRCRPQRITDWHLGKSLPKDIIITKCSPAK